MKNDRVNSYETYYKELSPLKGSTIDLPYIPNECLQNGHMFYIKVKDIHERNNLQSFLRGKGIGTAFHYIPLHSAPEGLRSGRFEGEDVYTTNESERLLRLPMYYKLSKKDIETVCKEIKEFYK